jgi:regulator of sigma D
MSPTTPRLEELLNRLRTYCETRRGSKTELAQWLGVRPHMISEWLAGKQPGGEYALGILEWLEQHAENARCGSES